MKLLLIFSVLFLGLKAQELDDYEIDYYDVVDYSIDPSFLINDDDDFEADEYDFDDDDEVSDYEFVDDEEDDENDYLDEYDDYNYGDVSDYDFVDDDDEEYDDYDEEDDDISDYDLADDKTNLYDYQNWINDEDDYEDYDADDIGDDDESKALDEILGKLEKYQTAHRTMFIISSAVVVTALIWLYLCKCRAKGNAAKTELPSASQGRGQEKALRRQN